MSFDYLFEVTIFTKFIEGHQKLSYKTNYNDMWQFWSNLGSKKWSKSEPKTEQKKDFYVEKKSLWPASLGAAFEAMGPSKNAYFEDV